jgi:glycogen phosphorylase
MRPLRTFTVEPSLPEPLAPLGEVARNLWWTWQGEVLDLFRRLDQRLWEDCYHNPVAMLGRIQQERLAEAATDEGFLAHLHRTHEALRQYIERPSWWTRTYGPAGQPLVAYFCAEFGITECIPIYSGGLGVLAGDHLKSASELGLPLIGVGLLYQQGYFRQRLNADGWQLELFPRNDFHNMPVDIVRNPDGTPLMIQVDMQSRTVRAQTWRVRVGRIQLYLLDTNVVENVPEDRHITAQLYGGDQEMRIRQEILLGVGGVRMLKALGIEPHVYHMNEGHSAFLGVERIRLLMAEQGISFEEAREAVSASNVFTTHTPVPAGNDAFEPWLIDKYFANYWGQLGLGRDSFLALGRQEANNRDEPMSLTVLALRLSSYRNGVSQLHGNVSRRLWANVWPGVPVEEMPIRSITNGIHIRGWLSHDMAELYDRYVGTGWHESAAETNAWKGIEAIPDTELWRTHERRRERLVTFARARLKDQLIKRGAGATEVAAAEEALDPEALTIGFARRFATYKRAALILADTQRLAKLVGDTGRRVQILFAGKAHPRDNPGKDLIRQIVHIARQEPFRKNIVFIEDYDINVARYMVQGVDVWLNTPLRPMEASGTSGMKVVANGGLNISVLDGWWAEAYDSEVGWAIGSGENYDDLEYQNAVESQALYDLLEKEVVPLFFERGQDRLPRKWVAKMKASMSRLAPVYNTNRMVRQYSEQFYAPALKRWDELVANNMQRARELAAWRRQVADGFGAIHIESVTDNVDGGVGATHVGKELRVEAVVNLGSLSVADLRVELYWGLLDQDGQLSIGQALPMEPAGPETDHRVRYVVTVPCIHSGMTGYTVRATPQHPLLGPGRELAMIRWAG